MKGSTSLYLLLIALSPFVFFAGALVTGIGFGNPTGGLLGLGILYLCLALLVCDPGAIYRAAKLPLGLALATCLLAIPGTILSLQPEAPPFVDAPGPIDITIQPSTGNPNAVDISGLSFDDPITLRKAAPGLPYQYQLDATNTGMRDVEPPPAHFDDTRGNTLDFKIIDHDQIHIQDNRGGNADLHWDGQQFVLDSTHSEGLSASAAAARRGYHPNHHSEWGTVLLSLAPALACLLISWFIIQWRSRMALPLGAAITSAALQAIGIGVSVCTAYSLIGAPTAGDIPVGLPGALCSLLFYGTGIGLWCWQLLAIAKEIKRLPLEEDLTAPAR